VRRERPLPSGNVPVNDPPLRPSGTNARRLTGWHPAALCCRPAQETRFPHRGRPVPCLVRVLTVNGTVLPGSKVAEAGANASSGSEPDPVTESVPCQNRSPPSRLPSSDHASRLQLSGLSHHLPNPLLSPGSLCDRRCREPACRIEEVQPDDGYGLLERSQAIAALSRWTRPPPENPARRRRDRSRIGRQREGSLRGSICRV